MIKFPADIPTPSKYVSHKRVDDIANDINKFYCEVFKSGDGIVQDVKGFITEVLNIEVSWEHLPEPPNRICFARYYYVDGAYRITLNKKHENLFTSKPSLLNSSLSHEIGHHVLRHYDLLNADEDQLSLFEIAEKRNIYFHDSAWKQLDLSYEEFVELKSELAKNALLDERSRELLNKLEDKLEPEWMFWQAEQFASCFLIPKEKLFEVLNEGLNISKWPSLYRLRDKFGVSISMVKIRLEKLNLIEVKKGQIFLIETPMQSTIPLK